MKRSRGVRITRRDLVLGMTAAALSWAPTARALDQRARPFRRGGAIHTMMNWGALEEGDPARYRPRPFEAPRNVFPEDLVMDFRRAGFDFIRLTIDVGPFLQLNGAALEALEARLVSNIGLFHARGLDVIVDCHPVEQVPQYSAPAILDDLDGPLFRDYTQMLMRLAKLLAGIRSGNVALELMNEPFVERARHATQIKVWEAAQIALHDAVRAAAPDLLLILTGGHYGGVQGLVDLDPTPFRDSNARFSFHYYFPIAFTHQGNRSHGPRPQYTPHVVDLPYPTTALPEDEIWRRIAARIERDPGPDQEERSRALADARRILVDYVADPYDAARIEGDVARVADWADGNGIERSRVILGECGATRRGPEFAGADPEHRNRWFADLRKAVDAAGFGWAIWEINGREFGIQSAEDGRRIDPDVLVALGLR